MSYPLRPVGPTGGDVKPIARVERQSPEHDREEQEQRRRRRRAESDAEPDPATTDAMPGDAPLSPPAGQNPPDDDGPHLDVLA